jgi:hypothetical protein
VVELASVIRDLREELKQAIVVAEGEEPRFEPGPIELDVPVTPERSGQAGAKAPFRALQSGADVAARAGSDQRISRTLQPTLAGADNPPFVSGHVGAHER